MNSFQRASTRILSTAVRLGAECKWTTRGRDRGRRRRAEPDGLPSDSPSNANLPNELVNSQKLLDQDSSARTKVGVGQLQPDDTRRLYPAAAALHISDQPHRCPQGSGDRYVTGFSPVQ